MRRFLLAAGAAVILASGPAGVVQAQPAPAAATASARPVDAAERRAVVEDLAAKLAGNFVFPEVGEKYAAMLRKNLAAGAYDGLTDPDAFGAKVTADLQAVSPDGHLRLATQEAFETRRPPPANAPASTRPSGPPGMEEAKMIGDIAYLRFNQFPNDDATAQHARDFLLQHADAKAVIIDARPHRGGGIQVMDAILPLLYAKKTHLLRMDTRAEFARGGQLEAGPTVVRNPSPPTIFSQDHVAVPDTAERRLQHVPVYYLTSSRSASAAEHLALAFKRTHRATVIGETTRGAGHYGAFMEIGRFAAFVPVGRTYDPDTGWDWEGKGVAPDVAVPADDALAEALKRAKAAGAHPA